MTVLHDDALCTLHHGDCVEVMRELPADSVDAIVTDPPYGLEFMGKEWDRLGAGFSTGGSERFHNSPPLPAYGKTSSGKMQAWHEAWAREAFRVAKPGAHLLAFGGTRTYHRLAAAIEDAGWEIRDCLVWAYASGFPKSLDVSKAIDKRGGVHADFSTFRDAVKEAMKRNGVTTKQLQEALGNFMLSHYLTAGSQPAVPNFRDYRIIRDTVGLGGGFDHLFADEILREVVGQKDSGLDGGSGVTVDFQGAKGRNENGLIDVTAPATDAAKHWHGWGTALKPAWEPIVMARKPLRGTVAATVLEYGTGALNIDATRIPASPGDKAELSVGAESPDGTIVTGLHSRPRGDDRDPLGRWPANLILTDPIFDGDTPGVVGGGAADAGVAVRRNVGISGESMFKMGDPSQKVDVSYWDSGTYSRFFRVTHVPFPYSSDDGEDAICECGLPITYDSERKEWVHDAGVEPSQTYSRFFLIPKAARSDREPLVRGTLEERTVHPPGHVDERQWDIPGSHSKARENMHPTVKPLDLMRHLVRLVTPPGGTVLDCFLGSGTTAIAANAEGFRCIGIEREREYLDIALARMAHQPLGLAL